MNPRRKAALKWMHEQGEVHWFPGAHSEAPSEVMRKLMIAAGQMAPTGKKHGFFTVYALTDKGRQDLHEASQ